MPAHRSCVLVVLGVALCAPRPGSARADEARSLDEATFLAELRTRSPRLAAGAARARAADAAVGEHGLSPNPSLAYEREHVPGLGTHDDRLRLSWPVDLSGRRDAALAVARLAADATAAEVDADALAVELDARVAYAVAAAARERHDALAAARAPLAEITALLAERARAGDAATYDADRVALELDLVDDELRSAARTRDAARAALGGWLGDAATPVDATDDVPLPAAAPDAPDGGDAAPRADVTAAHRRGDAARAEARLARRWLPTLELGLGLQWSAAGDDDGLGYVVTLGGELPVRERGAARARRAAADAAAWDAEATARAAEAGAAVATARADLAAVAAQARAFADGPARRAAALTTGARVAYVEGDRGIVELLDALRAERAAVARALELRLEARLAELALWRAEGRSP